MDTIQMPPELNQPGISDGSELVPAEVSARAQRAGQTPTDPPAPPTEGTDPAIAGSTVDQEGLLNNYPITPPMYVQQGARFGWTPYAETLNGRLAMIGFGLLLLTEMVTGESFVALWSHLS